MRPLPFLFILAAFSTTQAQVPTPESVFGFKPGADYKMADYSQTSDYFQKVARASPRVKLTQIGETSMGNPMYLMFISSAKNIRKLEQYRTLSEKMARAKISENEARKLSKTGKAIVWIDAGMHANERAGAQMMPDLLYTLATNNSEEFDDIRENVIILLCPNLNPDGQDIMTNWYKQQLGTPWETTNPPVLYQKYVGHDNNRDWFMGNMQETRNVMTILYSQWYPQIVHNHHQTSPSWARIFLPPFRSPVNQRIHPGVTTGVSLTGTAMANYFAMKKMPGVISGSSFSMWWNGGMRTAPYYHNMIGILTETAHSTPTPRYYSPDSIPGRVGGIVANGSEIFYPYPWQGGESHFADAVNYMKNASVGILNLAADRSQEFLYNIYDMGRDAIEGKGNDNMFAYVIPSNQWDTGEALNLVRILQQGGIEIHQAISDFTAGSKAFKSGDFIIYGAQSFRPFLADLLEKQTYPDQFQYPGGPPKPPYDLAGWTLPMQMGIEVYRYDSSFVSESRVLSSKAQVVPGQVTDGKYYVLANKENNSALAINRLLKKGFSVSIAMENSTKAAPGYFVIPNVDGVNDLISEIANETGLNFRGTNEEISGTRKLGPIKVGIYKSWQANIDEGWTRWMLEQFEFDIDTLHNSEIKGDLSQYDAIIIPSQSHQRILHGYAEGFMPQKFTGGIGLDGTLNLEGYVKAGGVLITFDAASDYAIDQFGLPVRDVTRNLSTTSFFIPGSIVRINTDTTHQIGFGMKSETGAFFSRSRSFKRVVKTRKGEGGNEDTKPAPEPDLDMVSRYAKSDILMSGWAKGENRYLKNNGSLVNVRWGKGNVVLFGFKPQFRGQSRVTYKLIFNSIYMGAMK